MNMKQMKEKLKRDGLLTVCIGMSTKRFISGKSVFRENKWKNTVDVFGIYQGEDGRYCFFITDSERGIPEYSAVFATEDEVCDALIKKVARAERLSRKENIL